MRIRREELSQKLCYCSIHICHLTCNFGYFLLENTQSEYTNLFKFRFLGFSTLFLKIFRSTQKFYVGSQVSGLTEPRSQYWVPGIGFTITQKKPKLICVKMFAMILDSVFRLWTCLFWIENRKIKHLDKSLAQTRRWVCQGPKIQKCNHNKKYIPYSFFEFFYNFDCIFNLHSEIDCLLIFHTGASKSIKNSTTVNY